MVKHNRGTFTHFSEPRALSSYGTCGGVGHPGPRNVREELLNLAPRRTQKHQSPHILSSKKQNMFSTHDIVIIISCLIFILCSWSL